jgi:hypothetical protein
MRCVLRGQDHLPQTGIDSQLYLTQLITNMPVMKQSELDLWLPDTWKQRLLPAPPYRQNLLSAGIMPNPVLR